LLTPLLPSILKVVRAKVTSYSAFPAVGQGQDSRFLAGGDYYQISFNEPVVNHGGDLTIDWPGSFIAYEDAQSVKLAVQGCLGCPTKTFMGPADEPRLLTLLGAITDTKQASVFIALLSGNGTEVWSRVVGMQDVQPTYGLDSFAAIINLLPDNTLKSVAIITVATQLNYTCQWATKAQVMYFNGRSSMTPSRKQVSTVLQAPVQFSPQWGWRCQVPTEFENRMTAVEHFAMSILVGSGPETIPPTNGVAIVKRTKSRVLSIPSANECLRPGSSLHIIGVFDTSSHYSCHFGAFVGSSRLVRPRTQWDLLCEIPTSITRNQFINLREVTLWEWPWPQAYDQTSEYHHVLVDGAFFNSYCPRVFWFYSDTFWYEVVAAVAILVALVFMPYWPSRTAVHEPVVALELSSVM
jgi:hypothetical protein